MGINEMTWKNKPIKVLHVKHVTKISQLEQDTSFGRGKFWLVWID